MRLKKSAHTVYKTQYHVVLVTKYRRKILGKGVSQYLRVIFQEIGKFRPEVEFVEIGVDRDHVHPAEIRSERHSTDDEVKHGEAVEGEFPFLEKVYWGTDSVWSRGFFVSMVGINEQTIRNYVRWQGQEDFGQAQLEL